MILTFLIIVTVLLIFCFVILIRNDRVCAFRIKVNELCGAYNIRRINEGKFGIDSREWAYDNLPSYDKMLYSFKKLRLETYLSDELIKKLKYE